MANNISIPADGSLLNLSEALPRFGDDMDLFKMLLAEFVGQMPKDLQALETAAQEGDAQKLATQAHRFKGAASNFSIKSLVTLAAQTESLAKDEQIAKTLPLLAEMRSLHSQLETYLTTLK